ncbi:restriction endonuclease subunit S [Halobacillus amylolyticus]|uniref:Restriction endonuclease subunit S n=1 Tax=Halobacillus amylolyticus TaxID=2932259 RepID=A0ABY4HGX8_9BACI|nr:restriction endonuclease subunit S [Halobacillus amylolyticus]UOR14171.1 restriction endonuclease subunit S [Halobacillus amylolyticus]
MKLEDIVTVKVGSNISRGNKKNNLSLDTYTYEDLMNDLDGLFLDSKTSFYGANSSDKDSHLSKAGEVVFSFVSSKAAIVSNENEEKIINQNFAKLIIEHKQLDHSYLCYALNESHSMKKQMAISMQGSTVRKLTPAILKSLEMKLPSMEKQKTIGKAYLSLKKHQALAKKQADLEEQFYLELLKQLDQ